MQLINILLAAAAETTAEKEVKSFSEMFGNLPFDQVIDKLVSSAVDLALRLLIAIVVFYVGKLVINKVYKSINRILHRRQVDPSLSTFVLSLVKIVLLFVLIIIAISILGIETSSFIALFASAGVAIGMALSGTLQNFAGGVLILLLKPYKVGDFIEFQGFTGTVKEIQIFNTILNTVDNKWISIPNGGLSTGSINNYSKEDYRRVDWTISIAYGDDFEVAKSEILRILKSDNRIVKKYIDDDRRKRTATAPEAESDVAAQENAETETSRKSRIRNIFRKRKHRLEAAIHEDLTIGAISPKVDCSPYIVLGALGANSVDIIVRVWTPTAFYWGVFYDMNRRFYTELPKAGINFPFPQLDVHMC